MHIDETTLTLVLDEEQQLLQKTAQQFVAERSPVERMRKLRDSGDPLRFSRETWAEMAELGWLALQLPEAHEGLGLGFFDLCIVLEAAGRNLAPEPLVSTLAMGAQALMLAGSEAQQAAWLPKIGLGEALITVADREPGRAFDPFAVRATATRVAGGFELRGAKQHVLDGMASDRIVVPARTSGAAGELEGITLFLLDPAAPGVERTALDRIDHRNVADLRLSGVTVPEDAVLGAVDAGGEVLQQVLDRGAIAISAEMLGGAEEIFERTIAYLKERVQFDRPIGSFQALQHRAARLFIEIALARSSVLAAARSVDDAPEDVPRYASLAKARCSDMFAHVAAEAIQMHGGIGMTDEHDAGFYFKRAQVAKVTLGDPTYHRARWATLNGY